MKTLSLVKGFIIPFIVFWLIGVSLQVNFMIGGQKGTSTVLIGIIAAILSLGISHLLSSKYKEKLNRNYLFIGNLVAFGFLIVGYIFSF